MAKLKKITESMFSSILAQRFVNVVIFILTFTIFCHNSYGNDFYELDYKIYDGPYIDKNTGENDGSIKIYSDKDGSKIEITKYSKTGWIRNLFGVEERFFFKSTNNNYFINIVTINLSQAERQWELSEYEIDEGLFSSSKTYWDNVPVHEDVMRRAKSKLIKYWNDTTPVIKEYRKKFGDN